MPLSFMLNYCYLPSNVMTVFHLGSFKKFEWLFYLSGATLQRPSTMLHNVSSMWQRAFCHASMLRKCALLFVPSSASPFPSRWLQEFTSILWQPAFRVMISDLSHRQSIHPIYNTGDNERYHLVLN